MAFSRILSFILVILGFSVFPGSSELFSSINDFQKLVQVESEFIEDLREFIEAERRNLEFLERKLEIFEKENDEARKDPIIYVSNALNSFLLTHRLTTEIVAMESNSWETHRTFSDAIDQLYNLKLMASINEDKVGIVRAIAHLQMVYGLTTRDLVQGIIEGKQYRDPLSARNVLEIGSLMSNLSECERSLEWLKEALPLLENEELAELDKNEVYKFMTLNFLKCNHVEEARSIYAMVTDKDEMPLNIDEEPVEIVKPKEFDELGHRYMKICRGSGERINTVEHNLHCFFVANNTFSRLFSYKGEIINVDPPIYIFHDVMSSREIEELKEQSQDSLERAETTVGRSESAPAHNRTAKLVWLDDSESSLVAKLSRRIEYLTGLTTETSEVLQVQNYGVGGHYEFHTDFLEGFWDDPQMGDRIATFMFYLTDVELGGGTAFSDLNLLVKPKKGSAVFWYNLHKSLRPDQRTTHAACPVIIGNKWVANKWLRANGQIFKRPCDLKDDEVKRESVD